MSGAQRAGVTGLLLVALVGSVWWLSRRPIGPTESVPPAAATPAPELPTPPDVAPLPAPRGYRLAGVAVGEPDSFAVIEVPSGANVLSQINTDVPGLGRVVRIEAERVVVQGDSGPVELWLMPAASPTPTRLRAATANAALRTAPPASPPTPTPPPAAASSTPGSAP